MVCRTIRSPDGRALGVACGPKPRRPKCSTPGCNGRGELECDAVVERPREAPKRDDVRLHKKHQLPFRILAVDTAAGQVTVTRHDGGGALQAVSIDEWFSKTDATCDRPVCRRCAVSVGSLDYCGVHGRALERTR
jgi:hypothetical protein